MRLNSLNSMERGEVPASLFGRPFMMPDPMLVADVNDRLAAQEQRLGWAHSIAALAEEADDPMFITPDIAAENIARILAEMRRLRKQICIKVIDNF